MTNPDLRCELFFRDLHHHGHGFAFPCDPSGAVNEDAMSETQLESYVAARAGVGRTLAEPEVRGIAPAERMIWNS